MQLGKSLQKIKIWLDCDPGHDDSNSYVKAKQNPDFKYIKQDNKVTLRQVKTEKKMVDFEEKSRQINYKTNLKQAASIFLASNIGSQLVHLINGKKKLDEAALDLTVNTVTSTAVSYACKYVDEAASLVQGQSSQYLGLGVGVGMTLMTLINVCNAKTPQQGFKCAVKGGLNKGANYGGNLVGGAIGTALGGPAGTYIGSFAGGVIGGLVGVSLIDKYI